MKSMNQTCLVLGGWQRFAIQQMFLALTQILVGCLIMPSTSFLLWNLLAAVEEMVFDDGTRQSVICYRGTCTSAILFALFYQCNRASREMVLMRPWKEIECPMATAPPMTKPLTFAKPQHSTLFWDIDMELYTSIAKPRTFSIELKWMLEEKKQCLFLEAFGCDGVMSNQAWTKYWRNQNN